MKTKIISFSFLLFITTLPTKAQTWEFVGLDSLAIYHLVVSGDTIYAGTVDLNNNPNISSGLYYSFDQGNNWVQLDTMLGDGAILGLEKLVDNTIYIIKCPCQAPLAGTLYKSTNNGQSWLTVNNISTNPIRWIGISPFNPSLIYAIDVNYLGGGDILNSLFKSTDRGNTWKDITAFPGSSHGSEISFAFDLIDSLSLYVTVDTRLINWYLFKSTDQGENWFYISTPPIIPREIFSDQIIPYRIYITPTPFVSNDGGSNWFRADSGFSTNSYYISFYQDRLTTELIYILRTDGLYESRRDSIILKKIVGSDYLPLNLPFGLKNLNNITVDNLLKRIYLGTSDGVYRKNLITNIEAENDPQIITFNLEQNYPNPFNPITRIKYHLPTNTHATLKVYDLLGNELAILVNEEKPRGDYEIEFNGENFSSGIYIYTLIAGTQRISKKMMLIK